MSTTEQIMSADLTILRAPSWGQSGGTKNERAVSIKEVAATCKYLKKKRIDKMSQ